MRREDAQPHFTIVGHLHSTWTSHLRPLPLRGRELQHRPLQRVKMCRPVSSPSSAARVRPRCPSRVPTRTGPRPRGKQPWSFPTRPAENGEEAFALDRSLKAGRLVLQRKRPAPTRSWAMVLIWHRKEVKYLEVMNAGPPPRRPAITQKTAPTPQI